MNFEQASRQILKPIFTPTLPPIEEEPEELLENRIFSLRNNPFQKKRVGVKLPMNAQMIYIFQNRRK